MPKLFSRKTERAPVSREQRLNHIKDNLISYAMLAPNLILFLAFSLYPVMWTLKYVFYRYSGFGASQPVFVGFDNLIRVFHDAVYWQAVRNTFIYAGGKVLITLPISFFLAVILNKKRRANGALQSIVFTPTIMSSAVMGRVFYLLFNVYNGQINKILTGSGLVQQNINWLGKENAILGKPADRPGHIHVSAQRCVNECGTELIWITVEDDGLGIPPDKLVELNALLAAGKVDPDSGYGIFNVNERIKLYYGAEYGLMLESAAERGTRAT